MFRSEVTWILENENMALQIEHAVVNFEYFCKCFVPVTVYYFTFQYDPCGPFCILCTISSQ